MKRTKHAVLLWTLAALACYLLILLVLAFCGLVLRSYVRLAVELLLALGAAAGILQLILRMQSTKVKALLLILYAVLLVAGGYIGLFLAALFYTPDHTFVRNGVAYAAEDQSFLGHGSIVYYEAKNFFLRGSEICFTEELD